MTHLLFLVAGPSGRPQIAKMFLKKPDKRRQNRRKMSDRNWADPGGPFINLPANKQGSSRTASLILNPSRLTGHVVRGSYALLSAPLWVHDREHGAVVSSEVGEGYTSVG